MCSPLYFQSVKRNGPVLRLQTIAAIRGWGETIGHCRLLLVSAINHIDRMPRRRYDSVDNRAGGKFYMLCSAHNIFCSPLAHQFPRPGIMGIAAVGQ